jgi:hypothetical protein
MMVFSATLTGAPRRSMPTRGSSTEGTNGLMGTQGDKEALDTTNIRTIWLALALLTATLVGAATGLLSWAGGMNPPMATVAGAGAFCTTTLLILTAIGFVTDRHRER